MFAGSKPYSEIAEGGTDPAPHSFARGLARTAALVTWICIGGAAVSALAATAIYLPLHPGRSAIAPKAVISDVPPAQPRETAVNRIWAEEWMQLASRLRSGARARQNDSWLLTASLSPYATRFTPGDASGMAVATRLPQPRPDGIARPALAAPQGNEPRLAALPPQAEPPEPQAQPSEPGILDKLFGDPDRAAKAVLAAHPNTVLYDITKRVVYMPDGTKLEAHSGFGEWLDDPDSMHRKNVGVTPPNVYAVSFREKPFHGVRALRMKPVGDGKMYGRDGILAHSFLLGEAGASNGCISIREYDTFLKAFEDGQFKQIIVVRSIDEPVPRLLASAQ